MRAIVVLALLASAVATAVGCGSDTTTTVIQTTPAETTTEPATTEATDTTASTTPTEPTETTAPTDTTETSPEGTVPDVVGMITGEAKLALRGAGYKVFVNAGLNSVLPNGVEEKVCVQVPEAGAPAEPGGTQVKIIVRESCKAYGG